MNRAMSSTHTATTAAGVEVEREYDGTYVFIDNEFAGSLAPQYTLGDREAVICGWFVRDERVGVNYGARTWRRDAETELAHRLGITLPS